MMLRRDAQLNHDAASFKERHFIVALPVESSTLLIIMNLVAIFLRPLHYIMIL